MVNNESLYSFFKFSLAALLKFLIVNSKLLWETITNIIVDKTINTNKLLCSCNNNYTNHAAYYNKI